MSNIGLKIGGYCNGMFGRDDYEDKIIIFEGRTWIVCTYFGKDMVSCVNFGDEKEKEKCIREWASEYGGEEE